MVSTQHFDCCSVGSNPTTLILISKEMYTTKIEAYICLSKIANSFNKKVKENKEVGYEICYEPSKNKYTIVSLGDTIYSGIRFQRKCDAQTVINDPHYKDVLDDLFKIETYNFGTIKLKDNE